MRVALIGHRGHRDTSLYEHGKDERQLDMRMRRSMGRVQQYRDLAVAAVALSCSHTRPLIVLLVVVAVTTSMHSVGRCGGG